MKSLLIEKHLNARASRNTQFSHAELLSVARISKAAFVSGSNVSVQMNQLNRLNRRTVEPWERASRPNIRRTLAPIIILECYLSFTVFVFAFGPWPWPVQNPTATYGYLFLAQAALFVGYLSRIREDRPSTPYIGSLSSSKLLNISVWLNILFVIPYYYTKLGPDGFSAVGILSHIVAGTSDPGKAYAEKFDAPGGSTLVLYAYMLFSPVLWLAVPMGVVAWKSLSLKIKAAIVFIVSAHCVTYMAMGTTKGIADNAAIIAISIAATRRGSLAHREAWRNLSKVRRAAVIVCAISALVLYFSYSQDSRSGGRISAIDTGAGITLDTNNIFIAGQPTVIQAAVAKGSSYLSQGYYGLSLALAEPFQWSYGVGHSMALTGLVKKLTDFDAAEQTYNAREQHNGWDMSKRWDSVYPWLASDVTFPGTLVLLFLIGRLLASVWTDVQSGDNPYALPLFVMLIIGVFYFPANDQILSASESVVAFWGLLFLWLSTRGTIKRVWLQHEN